MAATSGIVYDERYLLHDTGDHPECPERLLAIAQVLRENQVFERLTRIQARHAREEEVALVHSPSYIKMLRESCERGRGHLDLDTPISEASYDVALLAVGGVLEAVDWVIEGERKAVCLVRPPGHHAEKGAGMGFCLFNNVAIAARHLLRNRGLRRILIVDWDLHHGNGTEHEFYEEDSVLYFSIHQSPAYPGTGRITDTGAGRGEGYNVNVPVPPGVGDRGYVRVFNEILVPIAREYRPEFVIVSAGQDTHLGDPLGGMRVSVRGFEDMTGIVRDIADEFSRGRLVISIEGGYNVRASAYSLLAIINQIADLGLEVKDPLGTSDFPELSLDDRIAKIREVQKTYWKVL